MKSGFFGDNGVKEVRKGYGMVEGGGYTTVINAVLIEEMYWDEKMKRIEGVDIDAVGEVKVIMGGPTSKFFSYVYVSTGKGKSDTLV